MRKGLLFFVVICVSALLPAWALAGSVEGTVQGLTCVTMGKICPVDREDPMIAAEKLFVVLTKDKNFYFVPNLDRAILARHINQLVRIEGEVHSKYNAIHAEKLEVLQRGSWKKTWSSRWQEELYEWLAPF